MSADYFAEFSTVRYEGPDSDNDLAYRWYDKDRVVMGKDTWEPSEYATYFRVLETSDEYFDYYRKRHAFWKMYGLDLPDEVLKKLYYKNSLRLIPGIDPKPFPK